MAWGTFPGAVGTRRGRGTSADQEGGPRSRHFGRVSRTRVRHTHRFSLTLRWPRRAQWVSDVTRHVPSGTGSPFRNRGECPRTCQGSWKGRRKWTSPEPGDTSEGRWTPTGVGGGSGALGGSRGSGEGTGLRGTSELRDGGPGPLVSDTTRKGLV